MTITPEQARMRLIEVGARAAQDLGVGRMVGQILVYLYLSEDARSLDNIVEDLHVSKASASIAARQLESLGLVHRVWMPGDRRSYYRTAENIRAALQQGLLTVVKQRVESVGAELDAVHGDLSKALGSRKSKDHETQFLFGRVKRAKELRDRVSALLRSRILRKLLIR
jgi:DNA-binding transcriptional regulator GbsR (MarR family)